MTSEPRFPKTELERAYAQARSWRAIRSWHRGTLELRSKHMVSATGYYLAMIRTHALAKRIQPMQQTLLCVCQYSNRLAARDKKSIVEILCTILSEIKEQDLQSQEKTSTDILIEKRLLQSAIKVTELLKDDKALAVAAIFTIKRYSELDLIGERIIRNDATKLKDFLDESKVALTKNANDKTVSTKKKIQEGSKVIRRICAKADQLPGQRQVAHLMFELINSLIDQHQFELVRIASIRLIDYVLTIEDNALTATATTASDASKHDDYGNIAAFYDSSGKVTAQSIARANSAEQDLSEHFSRLASRCHAHGLHHESIQFHAQAFYFLHRGRTLNYSAIYNLVCIGSVALVSKSFDQALKAYRAMDALLLCDQLSTSAESLQFRVQQQIHLFEKITNPDKKLDLECVQSMTLLVYDNIEFNKNSIADDLLTCILELVHTRYDLNFEEEIFEELWRLAHYGASRSDYYSLFIKPLSIMTEQILGSNSRKSTEYYQKIFGAVRTLSQSEQNSFWQDLIATREAQDGGDSTKLLPLMSILVRNLFDTGNVSDCLALIERIRRMEKVALHKGTEPFEDLVLYTIALLNVVAVALFLEQDDEANALACQIQELFLTNNMLDCLSSDLCDALASFLVSVSKPGLQTPKIFHEIIENLDADSLNNLLKKMAALGGNAVIEPLVRDLISIRGSRKGESDITLIPLLYKLVLSLETQNQSHVECDDTYRVIGEIEIQHKGNRVFEHRMNFVDYLLRTGAHIIAGRELLAFFEPVESEMESEQVGSIFTVIDKFLHEKMARQSIHGLVALLSSNLPITFDSGRYKTFDDVFTLALMEDDPTQAETLLCGAHRVDDHFLVEAAKRYKIKPQFDCLLGNVIELLRRMKSPSTSLDALRFLLGEQPT